MALSVICSPAFYTIEEDFFKQFNLEPEKIIASGMCGDIVLAKPLDKPDGRLVVKKFTPMSDEDKLNNMRAFQAEVQVMQSFNHPFVMKCLIAAQCPRYLAICTNYYQKGTLDCHVGQLSPDLIELSTIQVACALRYLHKHNVVHLDVKLKNIFVDCNFNAVLGDFGLAKKLFPNQKTVRNSKFGGTRAYLAPERIGAAEDKELDPYKIDSFCLGVVLWSLLLKREPAININYYVEARNDQDLPPTFRDLLLKLVDGHPARRLAPAGFLNRLKRDSAHKHVIDRN